jgi:hypothetical protein
MAANPKTLSRINEPPEAQKQESKPEDPLVKLAQLTAKANENPRKNLAALIAYMNSDPDLFNRVSMFARFARNALIDKIAGSKSEGSWAVLARECNAFVGRLTRQDDSALEHIMIGRITMCWLRLLHAENYMTMASERGVTLKQYESADKSLSRAHARFNRACESLARIRKLRGKSSQAGAAQGLSDSVAATRKCNQTDSPIALSAVRHHKALPRITND